jgi:hypothetical protein
MDEITKDELEKGPKSESETVSNNLPTDEPLEMTPDEFFEEFDKATAFQIMGQRKPKEQEEE